MSPRLAPPPDLSTGPTTAVRAMTEPAALALIAENPSLRHGEPAEDCNPRGSSPVSTAHVDAESQPPSDGLAPAPTKAGTAAGIGAPSRALAPDLLRGLLMMLMALDHNSIALHTWPHGLGRELESDGTVVRRFNTPVAYTVRALTHLCAPGFTFLLGMGVVYLGRSRRRRLGWGPGRLARYFAVRSAVLTGVTIVVGVAVTQGRLWFLNMVLFSLAINYLLAGLLWLLVDHTEEVLARWLAQRIMRRPHQAPPPPPAETRPLLARETTGATSRSRSASELAASVSWHTHNLALLALAIVTIWWNIWLSDYHGCANPGLSPATTMATPRSPWLRIWFWPITDISAGILSGFPPFAWLSFALLGLLYGRIAVARPWTPGALAAGQTLAALLFALLFVLTRLLHLGNLSEDCLQTPAQRRQLQHQNPYLASPPSFFYVIKYPPDVAFWALTMAGNLLLLAILGAAVPARFAHRRLAMLLNFGTSALFFYVAHLAVLFSIAMVLVALFGHGTGIGDPQNPANTRGIDSLWVYWGTWALSMLLLWPACRAYSSFKNGKPADSIWRFF